MPQTTNYGTQTCQVQYGIAANSVAWNQRNLGIVPPGLYSGGALGIINNTTVSIAPLVCEIQDGNYQVRISTAIAQNITVSTSTPYIVLRWSYSAATNNYMAMLAVAIGSIQSTDIVLGQCVFSGSTLTGIVTNNLEALVDILSAQTLQGLKTFNGGCVIQNVTADPGSPANGQIWMRTDF